MVDSEEKRFVDRIRAIIFREAKEAGAAFIMRQWVAQQIGRSEEFVKNNWRRDPHDCKMDKEGIGRIGCVLNQHEKRLIRIASNKQHQSCRKLSKELKEEEVDSTPLPV